MTGSFELVPLQRGKDETLDPPHPHTQSHDLHSIGLPGPGCAADGEVGIFVHLGVEWVHNAQGIVMTVKA